MNNIIRKSTIPFGALVVAVLFFAVIISFFLSGASRADDNQIHQNGRLITIHDRGTEKVVLSEAATIGDVLKEANIEINSKDIVEPAVDEKMVASDYQVNIYRSRPVIIVDGNIRLKVITAYQTATQIAQEAGVKLFDEDITSLGLSKNIVADGAGLQLTIERSTSFTFNLFGKVQTVRTQAKTVGEMLTEKNIKLDTSDKVSLDQSAKLSEGLTVRVWRESKQTITVDEVVNFEIEKIKDADQPVSYREIKTTGEPGVRSVSYEVTIQDGLEVGRVEIASITTKQPKKQVEIIGIYLPLMKGYSSERASIMSAAGISEGNQGYAAYIIDHENASWCPTRWQGQSGCPAVYQEKFPGAENSSNVGYGLCQATPGSKMASAGPDWRTNPVTQMRWCNNYAVSRYVTWQAAYEFKLRTGWW